MLPTDQQAIASCTSYVFLYATTDTLIVDILHEEQKNSRFEATAQN